MDDKGTRVMATSPRALGALLVLVVLATSSMRCDALLRFQTSPDNVTEDFAAYGIREFYTPTSIGYRQLVNLVSAREHFRSEYPD